ncbi:flocculation protein FLO11-like [Drosophila subobscura]|uniref:flocculation protein FLO11-like n=1 Tax=Drosophila subobscura TaxID=7241 RepID=UPI00155AFAF7|nr:flocculation protein FLO11-like [Drosophila subobscura]
MLKWAVNQPRPSYLAKELPGGAVTNPKSSAAAAATGATGAASAAGSGSGASSYSEFHALRGKLKRKSLCLALAHGQGKENQLTSTPLPASSLSMQPRTPLLKDLSNIMSSPLTTPTPRPHTAAAAPTAYASTLPTFEAEYSPSAAIIPGPLLALRGMGIPDSYFEKPRYLELKALPQPLPVPQAPATKSGQTTLSSSQMGDVTLERMIDAILESTRKAPAPRQQRQRLRHRHRHHPLSSTTSADTATHSPTYRPAFDPASDLCEYWKSPHASGYEEREVRSPQPPPELPGTATATATAESQSQGKRRSLQLRRQRVVRRKRKIATRISSSVRHSAQKLLAAARSAQKIRHISPDSGHNSTSDCDFEEEADSLSSLGACGGLGLGLEAGTKRRLSFSFQEDLFVEK